MKELKLEKEVITKKEFGLGLLVIIMYFSTNVFASYIIHFNNALYYPISAICSIFMMVFAYFCFRKRIKRDFKAFWQNKRKYLLFIFQNQLIMYALYFLASFISVQILGSASQSVNQTEIEKMPIAFLIFTALIYAPFVEELLFRGSIRRIIKHDWIFIIASGLIFGLLHTIGEATTFEMIIKGLPYITMGTYFAYMYVKSENISTSMICHLFQNFLGVITIIAFK